MPTPRSTRLQENRAKAAAFLQELLLNYPESDQGDARDKLLEFADSYRTLHHGSPGACCP